jgi:EAL domain-containing protein (putative c-di-GMP-specific phosphodiesterase class I)
LRAIVSLGRKLGALVVAEGVESPTEAVASLDLGVDMLQGYLIAHPQPDPEIAIAAAQGATERVAQHWRDEAVNSMLRRRKEAERYREVLSGLKANLESASVERFDAVLARFLGEHPHLECLFVVDEHGVQATETVLNSQATVHRRGHLFAPAPRGTDHSAKDYYYAPLDAGLKNFVTEPYISFATGNMCRTWSCAFQSANRRWIACMDVHVDRE